MARRSKRRYPPRAPDVADSYAVWRDQRGLLLRPLATAGPGRQARYSMLAAALIGLAALGAGFAIGYDNYSRMVAHGTRESAWVPWLVPGGVLYLIAVLAAAGLVKLVVTRNTVLLVSGDGGVRYGRRSLVAPGEVAAVCLDRRSRWTRSTMDGVSGGPRFEIKGAYVYVVTTVGGLIELPAPYFSDLRDWPTAEALAAALSEALRVPLATELPPGPDPNPCPTVFRHRVAGVLMFALGSVVGIVGSILVLAHVAAAVTPAARPPARLEWWAGLPFVAGGDGFGWLGCRLLDWGWRWWLALLAAQLATGGVAVLAIHSLG